MIKEPGCAKPRHKSWCHLELPAAKLSEEHGDQSIKQITALV